MVRNGKPDDRPSIHRRLAFVAGLTAALSSLFATPVVIFCANAAFFDVRLPDLLLVSMTVTALAAAALGVPALLLSDRLTRWYSSILAAVAVLLWLYANVQTMHIGPLHGVVELPAPTRIARLFDLVGLATAVAVVVLALRKTLVLHRALLLLLLVVSGATAVKIVQHRELFQSPVVNQAENAEFFRVSKTSNVFVIVFDAFQTDVFEDVLETHARIPPELQGFTLFRETLGVSASTTLALPALHSGEQYVLGESLPGYQRRGTVEGSFLTELADAGWSSAHLKFRPSCPERVPCYTAGQFLGSRREVALADYTFLLDLSAWRAFPNRLKKYVVNDGAWLFTDLVGLPGTVRNAHGIRDLGFFMRFIDELEPTRAEPAARFMHLVVPHSPIVFDEECQVRLPTPWTREFFTEQATCTTRTFLGFLERLRELSIYDSSTIAIVADHGAGFRDPADQDGFCIHDLRGRDIVPYASTLLAVKPPGATGDLHVSGALGQLTDLRSTICTLIRDCSPSEAPSLFALDEHTPRQRRFDGSFLWGRSEWDRDYPAPFTSYLVDGPVRDRASWRPIHGEFPTEIVSFDKNDALSTYGHGWAKGFHQEEDDSSRWVTGKSATLYVQLPLRQPARLRFLARTWHPGQTMSLVVNGRILEAQLVPNGVLTELVFTVPASAIDAELSVLELRFSKDAEAGADWLAEGRLSVLFDEMTVERSD
jgi:hypothetical protein